MNEESRILNLKRPSGSLAKMISMKNYSEARRGSKIMAQPANLQHHH